MATKQELIELYDTEEVRSYKEGVWAYMLEHSRILPSGKMRIIFDTDGYANFQKRVFARVTGYYHREDYKAKEKFITEKREIFITTKQEKKARYEAEKRERRGRQHELEAQIKKVERFNRRPRYQRFIIRLFNKI